MNESRLFVGNLPYQTMDSDLQEHFSAAGVVSSVNVMLDKFTGKKVALRTLAPEHEDRALPEAELARALSTNARALKFTGLAVLDAREDGDRGEVAFLARVYEKGQDRSFVERSEFRREGGAWRYVGALEEPRPPTDAERARLR